MRRHLAFGSSLLTACVLGAVLLAPSTAHAGDPWDSLASDCSSDPLFCKTGQIAFERVDKLPIEWQFDTGWVPQGSPLQVHIWAGIYATTLVKLAGSLETTWPDALTLKTPGSTEGGLFGYHYGAEFGAQGKFHVKIAGQDFDWQGDLPYVPQFDFHLKEATNFPAWGFDPGVLLSSKTQQQKLASVDLTSVIGLDIPGFNGGFELDVALELQATWINDRIVIETTDGEAVKGGPITSEDGETNASYLSGPFVEYDVHPEGTVDYDGVVHMIPAFYIEILGKNFNIPVADIPIAFPITTTDWVFEPQRVHVPLPDLVLDQTEIDFGMVEVGQKALLPYKLWNAGEAAVAATVTSTNPAVFPPWDTAAAVEPSATVDSAVRFTPTEPGKFEEKILVASNDPSDPVQEIIVKGEAYDPLHLSPRPEQNRDDSGIVAIDTGCDCSAAGGGGDQSGNAGALAFGAVAIAGVIARRRRSTTRR